MNPAPDVLYRVHQFQAARRGHLPLAYSAFQARLPTTYETDLTGLLPPTGGQRGAAGRPVSVEI